MTKSELAKRIRKSVRWIELQMKEHEDFPAEMVGGTWRFQWPEVQAWFRRGGR